MNEATSSKSSPNPELLASFGDFVIAGIQGKELSEYDKQILETYRPVGILLLARNFNFGAPYAKWLEEYAELIQQIKQRTGRAQMLITLDHEGGHVVRPPLPITRFPYPRLFREQSAEVARAIAIEMKSLGVNVCWSPDTDIFSNPANTVIGNRAFGTTLDDVIKYSVQFYEALKTAGIIGCAKHFPGHGDTIADSHFELPIIDKTYAEIAAFELKPFEALIKAGVPIVMSSHILFPKIDAKNPGTLSAKITRQILREELKFSGVVCSDDLHMKAIMNRFQEPGVMQTAFDAGLDMFIMARHPTDVDLLPIMANDFARCIEDGRLAATVIDESRARVNALLNMASDYTPFVLDKETLRQHAELAQEVSISQTQSDSDSNNRSLL